ncbi:hypothetical protein [Aeromicrobium chenweiae]|uniref:Uncharacterized protein n=1 Tax=Aeromicrobium chenweiae TaxID=2079793 RepID=A0A2S0WJA1_9ACTN|nr:hypothetical protein [Aeromicrobium chenweiae]AWB91416.1 hypothetical protein C3E78_03825 [Aeromicrobium chenweiae]TGN30652.1 hypothetical protein E4L97_16310 [Aeromicrobium chenweiae]
MSLAGAQRLTFGAVLTLFGVALVLMVLRGGEASDVLPVRAAAAPAAGSHTGAGPTGDEDASEVISEAERPADEGSRTTASGSEGIPRRALREPVKGPLKALPVLPTSSVKSREVSSGSDVRQVSLVATDGRSPARVLAAYRRILGAYGFVESSVPAVGGSTASAFARGREHLTVTASATGRRTTYSVFGGLRAGSS